MWLVQTQNKQDEFSDGYLTKYTFNVFKTFKMCKTLILNK